VCLLEQLGFLLMGESPNVCGSEEHRIGVCADDAIQMARLPWIGDATLGKMARRAGS